MTTNIISFQLMQQQQQSPSRPNNLVSSLQQPVSPAQLGQTQTVMMQQPTPKIVTTIHQPQFSTQVWPLMHLYSVGFLFKNHWFAWSVNQWAPHGGEYCYVIDEGHCLTGTGNVSVFGLGKGAPQGASNIGATEVKGHRHLCCPRRADSRTLLTQLTQTLNVFL